jgi:two-component system, chemotaxis family, chemotaxis protein CheV
MTATTEATHLDSGVLLEAGTNEVEILVFRVGSLRCGVNVAKVREVRRTEAVLPLPQHPAAILGVIAVREHIVSLVDLRAFLGCDESPDKDEEQTDLVLEFNSRLAAFRVQGIERVFRISWKDLMPLPKCPGMVAPVTGVVLLEGDIVTLLDFESIGAFLGVNRGALVTRVADTPQGTKLCSRPLLYVDDSALIRRMLKDALTQAGYSNIRGFADGQEVWDFLEQLANEYEPANIGGQVGCVISDIEMPRMDGFHLTKRIREHTGLSKLPVVLFSSLVSKDNEKKGRQVGATAQISKPKWEDLTETLTYILQQVVI